MTVDYDLGAAAKAPTAPFDSLGDMCYKVYIPGAVTEQNPMPDSLRVLIVEDSLEDAVLIVQELSAAGFEVNSERVANAVAMQAALKMQTWDLIISDYSIPGFGGPAALALYQRKRLEVPFIMVSGGMGEDVAVEMIKSGAHNFVMKDQLGRLVPAVRQELRAAQERRVRKQAEATAACVVAIVRACDLAIIGTTLDGTVASWNADAERMLGYTAAEMAGHTVAVLIPAYRPEQLSEILARLEVGGHVESSDTTLLRKDERPVHVLLAVSAIKEANERVIGALIVAHDITGRKLEENERLALIQDLTAALVQTGNIGVQNSGKR